MTPYEKVSGLMLRIIQAMGDPETDMETFNGFINEPEAVGILASYIDRLIGTFENDPRACLLQELRDEGWTVGAHNDYRLNGNSYTFWLLVKDNRCFIGEGHTDLHALNKIRRQIDEDR